MDSENLKHRFDDGSISQMMFYNNLTEVAKQTSLEEAQAAISALLDSNIEDDIEGNLDEMQDDEDDTPLSHLSRKTNKEKKKEKKDVSRTRKTCVLPITHFTAENNKNNYVEKTPLMYFSKYFPEEIFVELAVKTNMYAISKHGRNIATNVDEDKKFVVLYIVMGVICFPKLRMY